jgi:chromosome segregation ATPase
MQLDVPSIPHSLAQVLWIVLASSVGWVGGWLTRRRREPHEIDKLRAETKQIHVTAENSQTSVGLETLREIQVVIDKAEQRREQWAQREEELRTQIRWWRNKAEELDGQLIDSREANGLLGVRLSHHENQERKLKALLDLKGISYSEADRL